MRGRGLPAARALTALRAVHPAAAPNAGFLAQLDLFEAMGCRLDVAHAPYRRFLMDQAAARFAATGYVDVAALPALPGGAGAAPLEAGATAYRCRRCRALVAMSEHCVELDAPGSIGEDFAMPAGPAPGAPALFKSKGKSARREAPAADGGEGGSLFVEPLRWMAPALEGGALAGKLYCPTPRCAARLGSFAWAGAQGRRGGWVTPAFQLHLGRLDAAVEGVAAAVAPPAGGGGAVARPRALLPRGGAAAMAALSRLSTADAPATGIASATTTAATVATPPARGFTHLILDVDGVMVDSERASCAALAAAIREVTGVAIPAEFPTDFRPVFGMDVRSCLEHYRATIPGLFEAARGGGSAAEWADCATLAARVSTVKERVYTELTAAPGALRAFPGIAELVVAARARGMGVALASSGSPAKIARNLYASGLAPLFAAEPRLVVSAAEVARGKPAPDVYLEALRRLGCADAARALVIEDAANGLAAAAAAGCCVVGVATTLEAAALAPLARAVLPAPADVDLAALEAALLPPGV
jgi:dual specificity phosphatase 12